MSIFIMTKKGRTEERTKEKIWSSRRISYHYRTEQRQFQARIYVVNKDPQKRRTPRLRVEAVTLAIREWLIMLLDQ